MDPVVVFERRLPGGAWWLVAASASWLLYVPGLVALIELLRPIEAQFRGSPLEHAFAGTVMFGGAAGWFLLPFAWFLLWRRIHLRYGRCELGGPQASFLQPVLHRRLFVDPAGLRVAACTPWGVVVETDAWEVAYPLGLEWWRRLERIPGARLLIPCEEADHARVLALLGQGPRS